MSQEFFRIKTWSGSFIRLREEDGAVVHVDEQIARQPGAEIYAFVPQTHQNLCFLIPAGRSGAGPVLDGDAWLGRIKPMRVRRTADTIAGALAAPRTGLYASAHPVGLAGVGELHIDRVEAREWEHFDLTPTRAPRDVSAAAGSLKPFLVRPAGASGMAQALLQDAPSYDALQAFGQLLEPFEVTALAARMMQEPQLVARLKTVAPSDIWAAAALPELSQWLASDRRGQGFPRRIGRESDIVDHAGAEYPLPSLPAVCAAAARGLVAPRRELCVLGTVRDEGIYLLEWLAYHRVLGVETFFLYTNDNQDGSEVLLRSLCDAGVVKLIDNPIVPGLRPQLKAYGHALQIMPEILDYSWVAVIDADEFIFLNEEKFGSLNAFIAWHDAEQPDSIALSWRLHRSNGEVRFRHAPVTERFPTYAGHDPHVKSIFRPQRFTHSHCHYPMHDDGASRRFKTADGKDTVASPFNGAPDYAHAWIGHYMFKSAEEYTVRRARGRADVAVTKALLQGGLAENFADRFIGFFREQGSAVSAISPELAARVAQETDRLRELPGVASAEARCLQKFARQSDQIRRALSRHPSVKAGGTPEAELLGLLERTRA